jgi:transcriptional regulator with XRE-family HTH domain
MDQQDVILGFETRAKRLGVTIRDVCKAAGINQSTFSQWKRREGRPFVNAKFSSLAAIDLALRNMEHGQ